MYDNLPEGFAWQTAGQHAKALTAVAYDGIVVCAMSERINNGGWFVRLDRHLERLDGPPAPTRDCHSYESGIAGCGLWVRRHQERLRHEAGALADALRAKNRYAVPWAEEPVQGQRGPSPGPGVSTAPADPITYRGDSRTEEEKAEAYSRELRRRRGSSRDWFKKKG